MFSKLAKRAALLLLALLVCGSVHAQSTLTPNVGFQIPAYQQTNWQVPINYNFNILDTVLGGYLGLQVGTATPMLTPSYTNYITGNTASTAITNFTNGYAGQTIRLFCGSADTFTTVVSSETISLPSTFSCPGDVSISFTLINSVWIQSARAAASGGGGGGVGGVTASSPLASSGGSNPNITCTTCTTSAAALTLNHLTVGAGSQALGIVSGLGTTSQVLIGNATGPPAFGAVNLSSMITGQLPIGNVGSAGLSATSPVSINSAGLITCTTCSTGTLASTQVAFGSGSNTIAGSANLTYASSRLSIVAPSAGIAPLVVTGTMNTAALLDLENSPTGDAAGVLSVNGYGQGSYTPGHNPSVVGIEIDDGGTNSTFGLAIIRAGTFGSGSIHSNLQIGVNTAGQSYFFGGNAVGDGSGNYSGLLMGTGSIVYVLGGASSNSQNIFLAPPLSTGVATTVPVIAVEDHTGAVVGGFDLNSAPFTNTVMTWNGSSSGSVIVGAAAAAGTPNRMNLPTTTAGANTLLLSDGGSPQQLKWSTGLTYDPSTHQLLASLNCLNTPVGQDVFCGDGLGTVWDGDSAVQESIASTNSAWNYCMSNSGSTGQSGTSRPYFACIGVDATTSTGGGLELAYVDKAFSTSSESAGLFFEQATTTGNLGHSVQLDVVNSSGTNSFNLNVVGYNEAIIASSELVLTTDGVHLGNGISAAIASTNTTSAGCTLGLPQVTASVGQFLSVTSVASGSTAHPFGLCQTAWVTGSGGGGSVNISGTPTAGQLTTWVNLNTIQGVSGSLTGAFFANEGTATTQTLHANPSGNLTWSLVALGTDVTGQLAIGNVGSAGLSGSGPIGVSGTGAISCGTCGLTTGRLDQFSNTSSTQLFSIITDESGSGVLVGNISPSFTTPTLGVASATSVNKITFTTPATGATFTLVNGKTLTINNTLTLAGTDGTTQTFSSVSGNVPRILAQATATLGTSAIASGACATVVSVAISGLLTSDAVTTTFAADPTGTVGYIPSSSGTLTIYPYVTAGNMNYKACNSTASSITPGAAIVLNLTAIRQ